MPRPSSHILAPGGFNGIFYLIARFAVEDLETVNIGYAGPPEKDRSCRSSDPIIHPREAID